MDLGAIAAAMDLKGVAAKMDLPGGPGRRLLVACGKTKLEHRAQAKDLYIGNLFRAASRHVHLRMLPWMILSAQHGLLGPYTEIDPYEAELPTTARKRRPWAERVVQQLADSGQLGKGFAWEFHAGSKYTDPLMAMLRKRGEAVENPLEGVPIGNRLSWYKQYADYLQPEAFEWRTGAWWRPADGSVWEDGPMTPGAALGGTASFMDMVMAPEDPPRSSRKTRQARDRAEGTDPAERRKKLQKQLNDRVGDDILRLMHDYRIRSLNAISVELWDMQASGVPEKVREALWTLVADRWLQHTVELPIRFQMVPGITSKILNQRLRQTGAQRANR